MTVVCLEALVLGRCLAAGAHGLARRFFREASNLIDIPWQIAVNSDLQNPMVEGRRTTQVRFINWYIAQLYHAAQEDGVLATRFVEVANLMRQPATLLDPRIALRVVERKLGKYATPLALRRKDWVACARNKLGRVFWSEYARILG